MCSLKEFGVRTLLWDLGAADPCANPRSLANGATAVQIALSSDARWAGTANFAPDAKGRLWDLRTVGRTETRRRTAGRQLTDKEVTDMIGGAQARPCSDRP
jgi:hypothetical protein